MKEQLPPIPSDQEIEDKLKAVESTILGMKFCHKCQTQKPLDDFQNNRERKDGKQTRCRECHTTGKVRGLLYDSCNRALGFVKDSTEVLENLIKYLKN